MTYFAVEVYCYSAQAFCTERITRSQETAQQCLRDALARERVLGQSPPARIRKPSALTVQAYCLLGNEIAD